MSAEGVAGTVVAMGAIWWLAYGLGMVLIGAFAGLVLLAALGVAGTVMYLVRIAQARHDRKHTRVLFLAPAVISGAAFIFHWVGSAGGPHFGRWLVGLQNGDLEFPWGLLVGAFAIACGLFAVVGWFAPLAAAWEGPDPLRGGEWEHPEWLIYTWGVVWAFFAGSSWLGFALSI